MRKASHLILLSGALCMVGSALWVIALGHSWARIGAIEIALFLFYAVLILSSLSIFISLVFFAQGTEPSSKKSLIRGMVLDASALAIVLTTYFMMKHFM